MQLIADSGGTTTNWALADGDNVLYLETPGMPPDRINPGVHIPAGLEKWQSKVTELYFYGTGCARTEKAQILQNILQKWFPQALVVVFSDLMALAHAHWGNTPGNVAIMGTGSSMAHYDGKKLVFEVKSKGRENDPGSGTHIGQMLLKAIDQNRIPSDLFRLLNNTMPEQSKNNPGKISDYAHFCIQNLKSPFIEQLCIGSFNHFFEYYKPLWKKYKYPLVLGGSIAHFAAPLVKKAANKHNIVIAKIIRKPIDALVCYYSRYNFKH